MGWAAARGESDAGGWALFAILAFWQMPHFFAIAWMYRDEYAKAGFKMLPAVDPDGRRTASTGGEPHAGIVADQSVPVPISTGRAGLSGRRRWCWAVSIWLRDPVCAANWTVPSAKKLFFASIIYLPLLLIALVANKVNHDLNGNRRLTVRRG